MGGPRNAGLILARSSLPRRGSWRGARPLAGAGIQLSWAAAGQLRQRRRGAGATAGSYPVICCASAVAGDDEPARDVSPQLGRPVTARASRPDVSGCLGFGLAVATGLDHFPLQTRWLVRLAGFEPANGRVHV